MCIRIRGIRIHDTYAPKTQIIIRITIIKNKAMTDEKSTYYKYINIYIHIHMCIYIYTVHMCIYVCVCMFMGLY